ncbi:MAG: dipeptidase [Actinomycetota bacterium]
MASAERDWSAFLRSAPLIDGHNDLLWELRKERLSGSPPSDVSASSASFQTDLPRLRDGGVGGQFWSVYVPSDLPDDVAVTQTLEQIDAFRRLVAAHPVLEIAKTADDIERIAAGGRVASMIGVEGGQSIGCSLGVLRMLSGLATGYLTLTHNDDNPWADSATGDQQHGGLTRFGEEVVRELNREGMLVDLSHVSDDAMRHALSVSEAPAFFSHSSARALCDVPRNVPDDVLELVRGTNGVVMVTFVPAFLTPEGAWINLAGRQEWVRLKEEHPDDPEAAAVAMDAWFDAVGRPPASVSDVADHVDHIREVAGIEAIGVGSDFDGAGPMPDGLEDVSRYPMLFEELRSRGYSDEELRKIAGGNLLRVLRETERVSARIREERPPSTATIEELDGAGTT